MTKDKEEVKAKSGKEVLKIAGKGLKNPDTLTSEDIQAVCGSVVSQAERIAELEASLKKALKNQNPKLQRGN